MDNFKVKIYFGNDLANLFELGWISADLSQLIEFSELVESGEQERAEKFFGEKSRPFNRYTSLSKNRENRPEIVDVKKGSVELVIAGASVAVAVIMPRGQLSSLDRFSGNAKSLKSRRHFEAMSRPVEKLQQRV